MLVEPFFRDRVEAGKVLAQLLKAIVADPNPIVLALPRGGVPVGFEVAKALYTDLDIFLVRKLGAPDQPELAIGAIASGGVRVLNHALIEQLGIPSTVIDRVTAREQQKIDRRELFYREGRPALAVAGRTIVLIDDGLATGATMRAAARAVHRQRPKRMYVAVPVASREASEGLRQDVDDIVCAEMPDPFYSVGAWYENFTPTSDSQVRQSLRRAAHLPTA